MKKMQIKFAKRLMAYVLTGAMIVSNMTSLTAFAAPSDEKEYKIETSSAIEETSDEEEKIVEEKNVEVENAETPDSGTTTPPQQSDVDQSDVDQSDVDQSDVDQSDVDQSDVDQSDVDQSDVDQSDVGTPDEDGFYDGFKATSATAGRSYYFNFVEEYASVNPIPNTHEKGLFSFDAGPSHAASYHSAKYGVDFKLGNQLTFKVSGDSYIVIGGDNNSSAGLKATCSDANGSFYRDSESSKTAGHAEASDCKTMGNNAVVFEYSGGAGTVTLTLSSGSDAYIGAACIIPLEEVNKTATKWDFTEEAFQSISSANTYKFKYKGLACSNAKNDQNKYLVAGKDSTITVPVKDTEKAGKVIVKACYNYAFSFESGEKNCAQYRKHNYY